MSQLSKVELRSWSLTRMPTTWGRGKPTTTTTYYHHYYYCYYY